jgi:8-oxo-dGTP pyrophosphatase MutT (NUDIX family)
VAGPNLRRSVRALLVDPADRLLLAEFRLPVGLHLWATVGGGIEPGESSLGALARELREEVGLALVDEPPLAWRRTVVLPGVVDGHDGQVEDTYWLRTEAFQPRGELTDEELAAEHLVSLRWWTLAELEATEDLLAPRGLARLFADLLRDGPSPTPIEVGI